MADIIIPGQSSANPVQASTSCKSPGAQKANTAFDLLLALFQSGELSGKFLPGESGKLEVAPDIATEAPLPAGATGQVNNAIMAVFHNAKQPQAETAKDKTKGTDPDSGPLDFSALLEQLDPGGK